VLFINASSEKSRTFDLNSLKTLANIFEMPGRPLPPKALPGPRPFFNNDAVPRPEKTALESVHAFPLTREILRRHGSGYGEFAKLTIPVLNQIIRPFTAKWHRLSLAKAFGDSERCLARINNRVMYERANRASRMR
jgi:hypothetical protein